MGVDIQAVWGVVVEVLPTIELSNNSQEGWVALGDYSFPADTATISLSNETKLRAIFADAIKLVKID